MFGNPRFPCSRSASATYFKALISRATKQRRLILPLTLELFSFSPFLSSFPNTPNLHSMSRFELSDRQIASAIDQQRGSAFETRRLNGHSPLNFTSERRSLQGLPISADDYVRNVHSLSPPQQEDGPIQQSRSYNDTWVFPPPDDSLHSHSNGNTMNSAFWNGPGSGTGGSPQEQATNTTNVNGTSSRGVAALSAFNHNQRGLYSARGGSLSNPSVFAQSNGLYSSYSPEFARDAVEPLLHNPPSTATLPLSPASLPALPQGNFDGGYGASHPTPGTQTSHNHSASRSTLWWGELEPWMDEEYAKQVCELMGWDPVSVKIPHAPADPVTGQQPNNPGYCFLTFPAPQQAAAVLQHINNPPGGNQPIMPNSTKPFVLNWASSTSPTPIAQSFSATTPTTNATNNQNQPQKEYSIFVGDLAPETSNSDLVAVFRNPVLGLRNDRAPKFIRPFYSCKSAKIMLDPVTGVSRGYGFVRFTDEADQQRALIEMHGLYCLSRPSKFRLCRT